MSDHIERRRIRRQIDSEMRSLNIIVEPSIKVPPSNYKNDAGPPKGAIFISNMSQNRKGSLIDVRILKSLYEQIGYLVVEVLENATQSEIMESLDRFRNDERLREVDSIILAFMSHGSNGLFLSADGEMIDEKDVYHYFSDINCPELKEKPKMFIFVYCRTGLSQSGPPERRVGLSNMFLLYSTAPSEASIRNRRLGTYYIYHMCQVFMNNAWQYELGELMHEVDKDMTIHMDHGCQTRFINTDKWFWFNPRSIMSAEVYNDNENGDNDDDDNAEDSNSNATDTDGDYGDNGSDDNCSDNDDESNDNGSKDDVAMMSSSNEKHVLLIDNLNGCGRDMETLRDLFTDMGYEIHFEENVDYKKFKEVIIEFKGIQHGDSAFIIFYGDGYSDRVLSFDHYQIKINELQTQFNDVNCPNLSGRPKVFIMNNCYNENVNQIGHGGEFTESTEAILARRDFLSLNVETERNVCEHGSLLTVALDEVFREHMSPKKLISVMHSVSQRMCVLQRGRTRDYFCELEHIKFTSDLYINPIKKASAIPFISHENMEVETPVLDKNAQHINPQTSEPKNEIEVPALDPTAKETYQQTSASKIEIETPALDKTDKEIYQKVSDSKIEIETPALDKTDKEIYKKALDSKIISSITSDDILRLALDKGINSGHSVLVTVATVVLQGVNVADEIKRLSNTQKRRHGLNFVIIREIETGVLLKDMSFPSLIILLRFGRFHARIIDELLQQLKYIRGDYIHEMHKTPTKEAVRTKLLEINDISTGILEELKNHCDPDMFPMFDLKITEMKDSLFNLVKAIDDDLT